MSVMFSFPFPQDSTVEIVFRYGFDPVPRCLIPSFFDCDSLKFCTYIFEYSNN